MRLSHQAAKPLQSYCLLAFSQTFCLNEGFKRIQETLTSEIWLVSFRFELSFRETQEFTTKEFAINKYFRQHSLYEWHKQVLLQTNSWYCHPKKILNTWKSRYKIPLGKTCELNCNARNGNERGDWRWERLLFCSLLKWSFRPENEKKRKSATQARWLPPLKIYLSMSERGWKNIFGVRLCFPHKKILNQLFDAIIKV